MLQREYFVRELEREWAQIEAEEKKVVLSAVVCLRGAWWSWCWW